MSAKPKPTEELDPLALDEAVALDRELISSVRSLAVIGDAMTPVLAEIAAEMVALRRQLGDLRDEVGELTAKIETLRTPAATAPSRPLPMGVS